MATVNTVKNEDILKQDAATPEQSNQTSNYVTPTESSQQKNTFDKVDAFANSFSTANTAAAETLAEMHTYAKNLREGKDSLVAQTGAGLSNLKKSVEQADHNTSSGRFDKAEEDKAIKSSINQMGSSFLANKESLRQSSNQYFETAGQVLTNPDILQQLGTSIWDNSEGNASQKTDNMNAFLNSLNEDNTNLFFEPGQNELFEGGELTDEGQKMLESFTPSGYDKKQRWKNAGIVGKVGITFEKGIAMPFKLAKSVLFGGVEMVTGTITDTVTLFKAIGGAEGAPTVTEALARVGVDMAEWGVLIGVTLVSGGTATAGTEAAIVSAEAAAEVAVEKAVVGKVEKTAASKLVRTSTKASKKATKNAGKLLVESGESRFTSVTGKKAKATIKKDIEKSINKSIRNSEGALLKEFENLGETEIKTLIDDLSESAYKRTKEMFELGENIPLSKRPALIKSRQSQERMNRLNNELQGAGRMRTFYRKSTNALNPFSSTGYDRAAHKFKQGRGMFAKAGKTYYRMGLTNTLVKDIIGKPLVDATFNREEGSGWASTYGNGLLNGIMLNNSGQGWDLDNEKIRKEKGVSAGNYGGYTDPEYQTPDWAEAQTNSLDLGLDVGTSTSESGDTSGVEQPDTFNVLDDLLSFRKNF